MYKIKILMKSKIKFFGLDDKKFKTLAGITLIS
jgi:hypothetical protein